MNWLFAVPEAERTNLSVILWWEKRRLAYNAIIGLYGICSVALFFTFIELSGKLQSGEDAVEPLGLFLAPFAINFCYTAGWIVELCVRVLGPDHKVVLGPQLMKLGIGFSLFVASLPTLIWGIIVMLQQLHIIK